jgi:hypothetical protein
MPGGQARMSGSPPLRRSRRPSHSCLTACLAASRPPAVAGEGRAFGACCIAGKLRSPAGPSPSPPVAKAPDPTSFPTRRGGVPLASLAERISAGQWPPCGGVERPGRAVRFARLIHRPVRVLGGPAVRAACGGDQMPTASPRRVCGSMTLCSSPKLRERARTASIAPPFGAVPAHRAARRLAARGLGCDSAGRRDRWGIGPDRLARSTQQKRKQ